ncbi:MAG: extracellular solute-binding protein [Clostridia bacterium]|nr:extracellular solute-binding protein [Clostridia bacterium]
MKKALSYLLVGILACGTVGSLAACGGPDTEKTFYLEVSNAGFGQTWVDPLIEIFEAEHPGITVEKSSMTKKDAEMIGKVTSGSTELDLIFPEYSNIIGQVYQSITVNGVTYESPFAEISDILNANVPGESRTMGDKMNDEFYNYFTTVLDDGTKKHYIAPWMQSPLGIVVNHDIYNEATHGKFPNTTNEFYSFCDNMAKMGVIPMTQSLADSYWDSIWDIWMYQYNGQANMDAWFQGYPIKDGSVQTDARYSVEMMQDKGMLEALKVFENIVKYRDTNAWMDSLSYSLDFTQIQNRFLEGDANIAMLPCGAWLEREMEANYSGDELNLTMERIPVISALGTKLGITDAELSAIIDYVDGEGQLPTFTSTKGLTNDKVVETVREARFMNPGYRGYGALIPVYSNHVDLAKEFLQLMASDRGIEAMLKECGSMAAYEYDIKNSPVKDEISSFMYSVNVRAQEGYCFSERSKLFTLGGLTYINGQSDLTPLFAAKNLKDYKSAETVFTTSYTYTSGLWSTYLSTAGITLG